ncbi:MAG: hypothetical protein JWL61_5444 [Gemmatimonadetes bacterium]|nr:hypothetical protein [Gemmatimonadota bacterium]
MKADKFRELVATRHELEGKAPPPLLKEFDELISDKFSGDSADKRMRRDVTKTSFTIFFVIVLLSFLVWMLSAFHIIDLDNSDRYVLEGVFVGSFVVLIGQLLIAMWRRDSTLPSNAARPRQ